MPLPQPKLDDRSYADLVQEALATLPGLYPEWTDHNPTDPGIVLIELFAWLSEMLLFRIDQIPERHLWVFLKLLNDTGSDTWTKRQSLGIDAAIRETVRELRARYRAVTAEDYIRLVLDDWPNSDTARQLGFAGAIGRAQCVPRRNLLAEPQGTTEAPGHVSLVVVPNTPSITQPQPDETLLAALSQWLEPRRLLGTRLHVVGPVYLEVTLSATWVMRGDYAPRQLLEANMLGNADIAEMVKQQATKVLEKYFAPLSDRPMGGWPFGRAVYRSEVFQLLDSQPGVDYVADVTLVASDMTRQLSTGPIISAIALRPHELVKLIIGALTVRISGQQEIHQ